MATFAVQPIWIDSPPSVLRLASPRLLSIVMPGKPRISVTIDEESLAHLQRLSAERGWDLSRCVREALAAYTAEIRGADAADVPKRRFTCPDAVVQQLPPYLGRLTMQPWL